MTPKGRSVTILEIKEREFMGMVIELARLRGWRVFHTFDSRRSQAGFPDLTMVRGDRLVFAELKTINGKLTAAQEEWLAALAQTPCEVNVWTPGHWEQIDEVLR